MKFITLIFGVLLLSCGCKVKKLYSRSVNQIDVNGDRITVLAYRIFIDGKLKENGYSFRDNDMRLFADNALGSLQYGDLNFLFFSSKKRRQSDGMAPLRIHNRTDLRTKVQGKILKNMIVIIDPQVLGENIYIDSLPLEKGLLEISPIDSGKVVRLSSKFKKLNRWKTSTNLVSASEMVKFRRGFALDTLSKKDPVAELFHKGFMSINFNEIKKWQQGH
jgi:hypothetical protein